MKKRYANNVLMAASKISKAYLDSKFTVDAVVEFPVGYQNARNKYLFLKPYATDSRGKKLINKQIKAVVVHVLLENVLGYKAETSVNGKDVVEPAFPSEVALFKFFHEHRNLFIRNQSTRF